MKDRRKTRNPFIGQSEFKRAAWSDGYKCGHNDGEMDERDDSAQLRKDNSYFRGVTMDQAIQVRHLTQELNVLRQSHKALDDSNERLRNLRDTHLDEVERLTKANRNQATTIKEKLEEAKYLRATIKNIQAKNRTANDTIAVLRDADQYQQAWTTGNEAGYTKGVAEGERRLHGIGSVGYDAGFITGKEKGFDEGNEEGYADGLAEGKRQGRDEAIKDFHAAKPMENVRRAGFEEGRKAGLHDWMMYFILYMQENDQDFAVCSLSDLNEIREATGTIRKIVDFSEDLDPMLEDIEAVLTKLEVVDR